MSRLGVGGVIAVAVWMAMFVAMTGLCVWAALEREDEDEITPRWRRRMGAAGAFAAAFILLAVITVYAANIGGWTLLPRSRLSLTIVRMAEMCSLFGMLSAGFGQGMRRLVGVVGAMLALLGWALVELGLTTTP